MDWTDILGTVLGGVAGYYGADSNKNATFNTAPWSGIQPYLVGGGTVPGYLTSTPTPTQQWQQWQQGAASGAEGSWLKQPPSMFGNYASPGTYTAGQPMTGGDIGSSDSSIAGIASMAAQLLNSDLGKNLLTNGVDAITPMVDDLFGITSRTTPAPVVDAMSGATSSPYVPYGDTPMLPIGSADYVNAGVPMDAFGADMAGYGTAWGPGAGAATGLASQMPLGAEAGMGEMLSLAGNPAASSLSAIAGPAAIIGGLVMLDQMFGGNAPTRANYDASGNFLNPNDRTGATLGTSGSSFDAMFKPYGDSTLTMLEGTTHPLAQAIMDMNLGLPGIHLSYDRDDGKYSWIDPYHYNDWNAAQMALKNANVDPGAYTQAMFDAANAKKYKQTFSSPTDLLNYVSKTYGG